MQILLVVLDNPAAQSLIAAWNQTGFDSSLNYVLDPAEAKRGDPPTSAPRSRTAYPDSEMM